MEIGREQTVTVTSPFEYTANKDEKQLSLSAASFYGRQSEVENVIFPGLFPFDLSQPH